MSERAEVHCPHCGRPAGEVGGLCDACWNFPSTMEQEDDKREEPYGDWFAEPCWECGGSGRDETSFGSCHECGGTGVEV